MSRWITARKKNIKNPPNFKNRSGECLLSLFGHSNTAHHTPFFYMVGVRLKTLWNKTKPTNCDFISQIHRLCVCASGSFITTTFNDFTLIKLSCLHFGQYRGKFLISVSSLIFMRVLFSHIGQNIQWYCSISFYTPKLFYNYCSAVAHDR